MAINLLGSVDAVVDYGTGTGFLGATAISVAFTVRTAGTLVGNIFFSKWHSSLSGQSFLVDLVDTDEIEFLVHGSGGTGSNYYGRKTTDSPVTTSTLLRVVCRIELATPFADIWVNGAVRADTLAFNNGITAMIGGVATICVGRQPARALDGVNGDYGEVAIWFEKVPDWVAIAYGKGWSPLVYRPAGNGMYAPMWNTSALGEIWFGQPGTNTAGTNATHPSMIYSRTEG